MHAKGMPQSNENSMTLQQIEEAAEMQ